MLTFVNEELFSFLPKIEKSSQTGKEIMQLEVATSNYLVTYAKGSKMDKYHNPKEDKVINRKHDIDMRDNPKIEPINREIMMVNYVNETLQKDPQLLSEQATSLKVVDNSKGVPTVSVRCLRNDSPNKSDLYVIAFPFNGMILPIAEDPCYRIYKGMIVPSVRPFYFNGRRYRKILYLVVEPHRALFAPDHKHHVNSINVTLDSFAIYKDRETGEEKTNHEQLNVKIEPEMMHSQWSYETLNEAKKIEPDPNTPLWVTFKFDTKSNDRPQRQNFNRNQNNRSDDDFKPRQNNGKPRNGQKSGYVEGNTYVTTNRHGIRKEVPINNRTNKNKARDQNDYNSIDRMMQDSGMFDEEYSRQNNRRGNKKGKKNKQNNRNDYWS